MAHQYNLLWIRSDFKLEGVGIIDITLIYLLNDIGMEVCALVSTSELRGAHSRSFLEYGFKKYCHFALKKIRKIVLHFIAITLAGKLFCPLNPNGPICKTKFALNCVIHGLQVFQQQLE